MKSGIGLAVYLYLLSYLNIIYFMSDDKSKQGRQDDRKVDRNDGSEVEYLHRKFPDKSHNEIKKAIETKGPVRKDIEEYLLKS